MSLRIGMITRHFPPGACGGQGYHVYHLSRKLVERGHKVTVYTRKIDGQIGEEWMDRVHVKRFKCFSVPISKGWETSLKLFFDLLKEELDLIHLHTTGLLGLTALSAAFIKRIPYFITIHDFFSVKELTSMYNLSLLKSLMLLGWQNLFYKTIINYAREVFCSEEVMEHLQTIKIKKKPVYLPSGVDIKKFEDVNPTFRDRHRLQNKKILLCVGSICKRKSQALLISALSELHEEFPELICVFPSPILEADYYDNILNMVKNQGLEDNVLFLKGVADEELIDIYKSSDVFVLPSVYEGFGIVIAEAWAAKKPVIVSDNIKIVRDKVNGLKFTTGNFFDLAKKIKMILMDKELCERLAENGRKEVEEKYSWDMIAEKVEEHYLKTLD